MNKVFTIKSIKGEGSDVFYFINNVSSIKKGIDGLSGIEFTLINMSNGESISVSEHLGDVKGQLQGDHEDVVCFTIYESGFEFSVS